ncbi:hypothetical protein O3P69_020776 [Scylla paramamosain]|uniref:Uncharacterized protein n=1 Tax=Scylla paramamosain TaxID=85552 RepID=A0AAW0TQV8_SCYPA
MRAIHDSREGSAAMPDRCCRRPDSSPAQWFCSSYASSVRRPPSTPSGVHESPRGVSGPHFISKDQISHPQTTFNIHKPYFTFTKTTSTQTTSNIHTPHPASTDHIMRKFPASATQDIVRAINAM